MIEMLTLESQMMGLVFALGPSKLRMQAGAWSAIQSGIEGQDKWTCERSNREGAG